MMNYELMTLSQLHAAWVSNWQVVQTGIKEILGDDPLPDPREVAKLCAEIPEDVWIGMFQNEEAGSFLRKTMDLQKLMAEIQTENIAILNEALKRH